MPRALIIAGPNGAGKTTFAREYLPNEAQVLQFINADLIAQGISPFAPSSADVLAGRIMIQRIQEMVAEGADFAIETTLSGNWLVKHILDWKAKGYTVELFYICLESPDISVSRVKTRVQKGGHHIPEDVIRRRFKRSLEMLERKYKSIVDDWMVYDNTGTKAKFIDGKHAG